MKISISAKDVHVGDIFESNSCGKYEIIEVYEPIRVPNKSNKKFEFKVRFFDTGNEMITSIDNIRRGKGYGI